MYPLRTERLSGAVIFGHAAVPSKNARCDPIQGLCLAAGLPASGPAPYHRPRLFRSGRDFCCNQERLREAESRARASAPGRRIEPAADRALGCFGPRPDLARDPVRHGVEQSRERGVGGDPSPLDTGAQGDRHGRDRPCRVNRTIDSPGAAFFVARIYRTLIR